MKRRKATDDRASDLSAVFFAALNQFRVEKVNRLPTEIITGGIYLVSHAEDKRKLLRKNAAYFLGKLESNHICSACVVAMTNYGEVRPEVVRSADVSIAALHLWSRYQLDPFLLGLWCIKDHSIYYDLAYFQIHCNNEAVQMSSFTGSGLARNSVGDEAQTSWAEGELQLAGDYYHKIRDLICEYFVCWDKESASRLWASKSRPRVARFFHIMMTTARIQSDVTLRITIMIQALEILFGTSTSELTHRLSLRIAMLLGEDRESKYDIYRVLKKCYGVRSTTVHGDVFEPKRESEICGLSRSLDDIVRKVATRVLRDDGLSRLLGLNSADLEDAFTRPKISECGAQNAGGRRSAPGSASTGR